MLAPAPLRSVTLRPHPDWRQTAGHGSIHDEWPRVERFAAGHPAIEADWIDSLDAGFDTLAREVFRASRLFNPAIANVGTFAPLWAKAKALGGDCIVDAELGNQSFSARGDWGLREDLRALRLPQLARNLAGTRPDHLSALHHGYHHLLAPYIPQPLKAAARRLTGREEAIARVSALRSAHLHAHGADRSGNASAWRQGWGPMSRGEIARLDHSVCDRGGADVTLAMQEIHGVRARDATAYRPLIEFCLSLPTEQFLRDGTDRFLARRMARGLMPEDQRCEPSMAMHNIDWHERIGARRKELADYLGALREDPVLGDLVDLARLEAMLANWSSPGSDSREAMLGGWFALTSAVLAGQFVGAVSGRNDL